MSSGNPSVAFAPPNRLAKILSAMDPKTFAEHVKNAEGEVERVAPILGKTIAGDVQALIRLCRQDEVAIFGQSLEIGRLALRIIESARLTNQPELAETAGGVWEMIEALSTRGVWHTDALQVHVTALAALTAVDKVHPDQRQAIVLELRTMRQAVGATLGR